MKTKVNLGAGAFFIVVAAIGVCVVSALRYLGDHKAEIGAGIGVLLQVCAFAAVASAAAVLSWKLFQARQARRAEPAEPADPPPPVRVASQQVPLSRAALLAELRMSEERARKIETRVRADFEEYMRGLRDELAITRGDDL